MQSSNLIFPVFPTNILFRVVVRTRVRDDHGINQQGGGSNATDDETVGPDSMVRVAAEG